MRLLHLKGKDIDEYIVIDKIDNEIIEYTVKEEE